MARKILSVILSLAICLSMAHIGIWAASGGVMTTALVAAAEFAGGSGTAGDPYLIATAEQLKLLADKVNGDQKYEGKYFMLTADIDLQGDEWTPIGNPTTYADGRRKYFSGTFDGNGHKITGLNINAPDIPYQGLFGSIKKSTIKNLDVYGEVTGNSYVAGIVGYADSSTIENCVNRCKVTGNDNVGGIAGENNNGTLDNCHNAGDIAENSSSTNTDSAYFGGVVGRSGKYFSGESSIVRNCYNYGTVSGTTINSKVGGVVGHFDSGEVQYSYNIGSVSGEGEQSICGGVIGTASPSGTSNITISCCYNIGSVNSSGSNSSDGGIVGSNSNAAISDCYNVGRVINEGVRSSGSVTTPTNGTGGIAGVNGGGSSSIENCYNTGSVSGETNVGSVVGRLSNGTVNNCYYLNGTAPIGTTVNGTTDDIQSKGLNDFAALAESLGDSWEDHDILHRPVLKENREVIFIDHTVPTGDNETAITLESFRDYVNGGHNCEGETFRLTGPIELNGGSSNQWTPIGKNTATNTTNFSGTKFNGTFDGDGHEISGLYINKPDSEHINNYQGLFGYIDVNGVVKNVTVKGRVTGNYFVAGIAGLNKGTVQGCNNDCVINGSGNYTGGIAGESEDGKILNCCNTGNVTGSASSDMTGGIVGGNVANFGGGSEVKDSSNTGTVKGNKTVGGIVGGNSSGSTVTNCYNSGNVSGTGTIIGGVVGRNYNSGSAVTDCGNSGNVSGESNNVGGVVGYSEDRDTTVTNCYNTGEVSGASNVGGVVGYNYNGSKVTNCYNTKKVSGASQTGGVAGFNGNGTVTSCYNTGEVSGASSNVGGVVGYNHNGSTTASCYNTGKVIGDSSVVGGVVGRNGGNSTVTNCYNTQNVSGTDNVGGVAGYNDGSEVANCYSIGAITADGDFGGVVGWGANDCTIENCYYHEEKVTKGIGGGTGSDTVKGKTEIQFNSGEAAWLLQHGQEEQVWYQEIDGGNLNYPTLEGTDDTIVYRAAFFNGDEQLSDSAYGNTGYAVEFPENEPTPPEDGYSFYGWSTEKEPAKEDVITTGTVTFDDEDLNIYAVWRENFDVNEETEPYTIELHPGETSDGYDLDDLLAYSGETAAAGNFTYSTEYDGSDGYTVEIAENILTVKADDNAKKGEYKLTITASEKDPQLSTFALLSAVDTKTVQLEVTVIILLDKYDAPDDDILITKSGDSIIVTSPVNEDGIKYEYSLDGIEWDNTTGEFHGLESGETYTVYVRCKGDNQHDPSESAEKMVTTVDENGDTTLLPGETVVTDGGYSITNDGEKITASDSADSITVTVTPAKPNDGVDVNTKGTVTVPEKSVLEPAEGPEMTLPDGGTADTDGNVTVKEGGKVQIGETTTITAEEGGIFKPAGSDAVTVPDGSAVTPPCGKPTVTITDADNKATVDKDGNITFPGVGSVQIGSSTVTVDEGGDISPDGSGNAELSEKTEVTLESGVTVELPEGGTIDADGNIVGGKAGIGTSTVEIAENGMIKPDEKGTAKVTEGSSVTLDKGPEMILEEDSIIDSEGNIVVGSVNIGGTVADVPESGMISPDGEGSAIVTGSTAATFPSDMTIEIPAGSIIHQDGSITFPDGAELQFGDTSVTIPENGTLRPGSDSNTAVLPDGTAVTFPEDLEIEVPEGTVIDKNGRVIFPDGFEFELDDATVTIPDGGYIEPNGDDTIIVSKDTSITKDGEETELPNGGIIDGEGNVLGEGFEFGDIIIIVPVGTEVTDNENGTVTVPDGSVVKNPGNAPDIRVGDNNDETVVDRKGNVTVPEDGGISIGNTDIAVPDGGTVNPNDENSVAVPEGSEVTPGNGGPVMTLPDGGIVDTDGNVTVPGGSSIEIGETTVITAPDEDSEFTPNKNGTVTVPDGSVVTPPSGEPEITIGDNNNEATVDEDGNVTLPGGGKAEIGGTTVTAPTGGGTLEPDGNGNVTVPAGSSATNSDGEEIDLTYGGTIDSEGNVTPNGSSDDDNIFKLGDTTIILPEGENAEDNGDGTATVPEGSVVIPPNGPEMTLPDGGIVDSDGNVTLPEGGEVRIGDAVITVPENGTVEPDGDGKVTVPGGSTVEIEGKDPVTVPENGYAVYDPETGELTVNEPGSDPVPGDTPGTAPGTTPGTAPGTTAETTQDTAAPETTPDSTSDSMGGTTGTTPPEMTLPDQNNIIIDSDSEAAALGVSIDEGSAAKLKEEVLADHLTPEERQAVENGAKLEIILSVKIAETTVSAEDKQAIEAIIANTGYAAGQCQYLNIELLKLINGQPVGKITRLNTPISVTIEIPQELRAANRMFAVVRVHDGAAEILVDQDADPNTITILTDRFSTYAIVYQDNANTADKNQATGVVLVIAPFIAAAAGVVISKRRK